MVSPTACIEEKMKEGNRALGLQFCHNFWHTVPTKQSSATAADGACACILLCVYVHVMSVSIMPLGLELPRYINDG
jgi:hypothetical protein